MTGTVFISYSRVDTGYVTRLADHLRELGIRVWVDDAIRRGERFADVIEARISECVAIMPVLTPSAVESKWVRREISYADSLHKPMLPLLLMPCRLPLLLHDLDYEDVTGGELPSAKFVGSLRSRIGPDVRRPDTTRPYARLRGLVARIEEVARETGDVKVLSALTTLATRPEDTAVLHDRARRLREMVRDMRSGLTRQQSEPAPTVWRTRLALFEDDARSTIRDLLTDVPELLDEWAEGWLNVQNSTREAVLFAIRNDIRAWQVDTLEPLTCRLLERHLPIPSEAPMYATRLAQSVAEQLENAINQALPRFTSSPWRRAVDYFEQFLIARDGRDLPGRARVRTAVLKILIDVADRSTDPVAGALLDRTTDVLMNAGAILPEPNTDIAELDSIEAELASLQS